MLSRIVLYLFVFVSIILNPGLRIHSRDRLHAQEMEAGRENTAEETEGISENGEDEGIRWNEGIVASHYGSREGLMYGGYGNGMNSMGYFCALPASNDNLNCLGGALACRLSRCGVAQPTLDELLESGIDPYDSENRPFEFWPGQAESLGDLYGWVVEGDEGDGLFRIIEIKPAGEDGPIIEAYVGDVGPWCATDPYWEDYSRPDAEDGVDARGRRTNRAGIDISYALAEALGFSGLLEVDWRWKTVDGAYVVRRQPTEWRW